MDRKNRRWRRAARMASLALGFAASGWSAAPAAAAEQPNVMIVVADDQRDDQMGAMDFTRSFFGDGGTEFTSGYVTTGLCCPSRSSIMSGLYAHNHRILRNDGVERFPHETSLQRELSLAGYTNGVFGKFLNGWPEDVTPPYFDVAQLGYGDSPRLADRRTSQNVRGFLEEQEAADDVPWFALYSARAPHSPYIPLAKYRRADVPEFEPRSSFFEENLADKPRIVRRKATGEPVVRTQARKWRAQQRMLLGLDDQIEKAMATMSELGETQDTLVFYLSDNGYLLGEHRLVRKGSPYREGIEVPFYMRWPGQVEAGAIDTRLAANVDIAPTIYDATGIDPGYPTDGYSLLNNRRRQFALAEYNDSPWHWAQVFDEESRYIETYNWSGEVIDREYYDLDSDPGERQNLLWSDPGFAEDPAVERAAKRLAEVRRCEAAACP